MCKALLPCGELLPCSVSHHGCSMLLLQGKLMFGGLFLRFVLEL
jgi:hypothetical protein